MRGEVPRSRPGERPKRGKEKIWSCKNKSEPLTRQNIGDNEVVFCSKKFGAMPEVRPSVRRTAGPPSSTVLHDPICFLTSRGNVPAMRLDEGSSRRARTLPFTEPSHDVDVMVRTASRSAGSRQRRGPPELARSRWTCQNLFVVMQACTTHGKRVHTGNTSPEATAQEVGNSSMDPIGRAASSRMPKNVNAHGARAR